MGSVGDNSLDRKGVDGSGDNHRHPQDDLEQGPHFLVKTFEKGVKRKKSTQSPVKTNLLFHLISSMIKIKL